MNEQKYKDEIEQLKSERHWNQTAKQSLENKVKDLEKEIRMKNTTISNYDQHVQANAGKMLQLSERIIERELTGTTQREKELEAELKISQLARNELRMEFEEMRDRYEKSDKYKIFFQLMTEFDTPEIKSLTLDQFDKKINRFFKMLSDQYPDPDDKQKCLDHGRKAFKCLSLTQHPDKNSNDPCAGEKFRVFNEAYANFTK
jgi:septal ring factor EnvC (AmiA/AmiB activator)